MTNTYPHSSAILAFLRYRVAEERQIASDAHDAPWDAAVDRMVHVSATAIRENKLRFGHLGYVALMDREEYRQHIAYFDPAHMAAEAEWKTYLLYDISRAIANVEDRNRPDDALSVYRSHHADVLYTILLRMVWVYQGHPDYHAEWNPPHKRPAQGDQT